MRIKPFYYIFLCFAFIAFSALTPDSLAIPTSLSISSDIDHGVNSLNGNQTAILKDAESTSILKQLLFFEKVSVEYFFDSVKVTFIQKNFEYHSENLILFFTDTSPPTV